ncbi:methyltransferase domain-containing protein [Azohydromonas aeria]|uniref:methyltransferase domain-containing protein n=1 Tax=Azohydromonas aeria TaxID=2590212 RepID=UPI0012FC245D|nr:methyltransferase domain-containing protein [Azohydromonas aeria]
MPNPLLRELLAHIEDHVPQVHMVVLGGSAGQGEADEFSDLDVFLFCEDDGLDRTVNGLCAWMLHALGEGTVRHGPFLRDEFGLGHRFVRAGRIEAELYLVTQALWVPAPAQGKGRVVYARATPEAAAWERRRASCRETSFCNVAFPRRFIDEQMLIWAAKVEKYLKREDRLAASWHALKFHQALVALEGSLASGDPFEPDYPFRHAHGNVGHHEVAMMHSIVDAPEEAMPRLLARARTTFDAIPLQKRDCEVEAINRRHWDELAHANMASGFYDVASVADGRNSLTAIEMQELPALHGLCGAHLQCGNGIDTLSLARLGAGMVGVDFSPETIAIARSLAARAALSVRYDVCSVLSDDCLAGQLFDFVYSSHGVLRWLPDLVPWARTVARLLRPGGFFYLFEIHPLVFRLQALNEGVATLQGDYFAERAVIKQSSHTHAATLNDGATTTLAHTDWTLASIVNALLHAGLRLEFVHEHAATSYSRKGVLPRRQRGLWHPASGPTPMPLSFSLKAVQPAQGRGGSS